MREAAIFDLDGTLLVETSAERLFLRYLIKNRVMGYRHLLRLLRSFFTGMGSWNRMVLQNKFCYAGLSDRDLSNHARDYFVSRIDLLVPATLHEKMRAHRQRGHLLLLLSGTLSFILEVFADTLSFHDYRGTELTVENGIITGAIDGLHPYGLRKVTILDELQRTHNFASARSYFYANHFTDRYAMEKVGCPVAVNPDNRLRRLASARGWDILDA